MKKLAILFFILSHAKTFCAEDTTITLLNNRLLCTLEKGYSELPGKKNLMGPEPSHEKEQYIKIADGAGEMTMYVIELFVRTSKNTEYEIREHVKTWKNEGVSYAISDKIKNKAPDFTKYIITPSSLVEANNALYASVFVECPDQTLISIGFYLNKYALKDVETWKKRIDKIIKSIVPGSRELSSNRQVKLEMLSGKTFELKLDRNFGLLSQKGHNMFVSHINHISSLSDMPSKLTVYSGLHPQEFFREQGIEGNDIVVKTIPFGTNEIAFDTFTDDKVWLGEGKYETEGTYLHFILVCYSSDVFYQMLNIIEKGEIK